MAADVMYGPCAGDLARPEVLHKQAALRVGPQRPIQIVAGAYGVHLDIVGAKLKGEGLGEPYAAELGARIGKVAV